MNDLFKILLLSTYYGMQKRMSCNTFDINLPIPGESDFPSFGFYASQQYCYDALVAPMFWRLEAPNLRVYTHACMLYSKQQLYHNANSLCSMAPLFVTTITNPIIMNVTLLKLCLR